MKIIKTLGLIIFCGGILVFVARSSYNLLHPCDEPIYYSIGTFDTRFNISEATFKQYTKQAGEVWAPILGHEGFVYKEGAAFTVNLMFDTRQQATLQKQKTESGLQSEEETFREIDAQFSLLKTKYENAKNIYEAHVESLKIQQAEYEERVRYWNDREGAPQKEYQALKAEAAALEEEVRKVNAEARSLNALTEEVNTLLARRNIAAENYNRVARSYNDTFGHGLEFNQAEYEYPGDGGEGEINVYQFNNKNDLILALSHEFGHALRMEHVNTPESIMYYITREGASSFPSPSDEDIAELKRVCKLK